MDDLSTTWIKTRWTLTTGLYPARTFWWIRRAASSGSTRGAGTSQGPIYVTIVDVCPCQYSWGTQSICCGPVPHFDLSYWAHEHLAHPTQGKMMLRFRPGQLRHERTRGREKGCECTHGRRGRRGEREEAEHAQRRRRRSARFCQATPPPRRFPESSPSTAMRSPLGGASTRTRTSGRRYPSSGTVREAAPRCACRSVREGGWLCVAQTARTPSSRLRG
jgi:hypothetical protein